MEQHFQKEAQHGQTEDYSNVVTDLLHDCHLESLSGGEGAGEGKPLNSSGKQLNLRPLLSPVNKELMFHFKELASSTIYFRQPADDAPT